MSDLAALLANPAHPPEWWNRGVRNVMGGVGNAVANAVKFPGQYARGETGYSPGQMASEQPKATNWAPEMAMGMVGAPGGRGGMGSGARLPMDEASRMRRMAEQGWSTDAYHGTNQTITEFSNAARGTSTKAGSAKQAHWLSENPQTASGYADLAADRAVTDLVAASQRAERNGQWDLAHDLMVKAENLEKEAARGQNVIPAKLRGNFKEFDAEGKMVNDLGESQLNRWTKEARAEGFDGVKVLNLSDEGGYGVYRPTTHYGVFEPKNIRSKFAAFDPANKDSGNLLGSLAALLGGGTLANQFKPE